MIILMLAIIGQVLDVVTTCLILNAGGIETNPLLGSDPNMLMVLLIKMTVIALIFYLLKDIARARTLMFGAVIGFGAAGWNLHIYLT